MNTQGEMANADRVTRIRALNDQFRTTLRGGSVVLTAGIVVLGAETQKRIINAVQRFEQFDADNDPWGEHDFGALDVDGEHVFFKLDYYDLERAMHSPDATDPAVTERVLTIMLASEY